MAEKPLIYHNPRCSKSRMALTLLRDNNIEPEIFEYLKTPLNAAELKSVLKKLGMKPLDLIRKNEAVFKEKFKGKELSDDEWIEAMIQYPKLIERPIVIKGNQARLGRPPEKVLELFQ